jgi:phosphatidylglycerophosphate synthase
MSHIINDEFYGESYMTVKYYKPFFEKVQTYIPYQITPNMISITNVILLLYLYNSKLYYNNYIFALFQFIFFLLDFVDGIHARKTNRQSKLGEILDHAIDPLRGILIIKMFFDILKINDNEILFAIAISSSLFSLITKYTKKYLYGNKYFSCDDSSVLTIIFTLFLNRIDHNIHKTLTGDVLNKTDNYS